MPTDPFTSFNQAQASQPQPPLSDIFVSELGLSNGLSSNLDITDYFSVAAGWIANSCWDKTVTEIWNSLNANSYTWYNPADWFRAYAQYSLQISTYSRTDVENVLKAYNNLILNDNTAPYQYSEYDATINNHPEIVNTINAVSAGSGKDATFTKMCLDQLYWGTVDGSSRIPCNTYTFPRTYSQKADLRVTPPTSDSYKTSLDSIMSTTETVVKYAIYAGLVIGGGYLALKGYKMYKSGKSLVKSAEEPKSEGVSDITTTKIDIPAAALSDDTEVNLADSGLDKKKSEADFLVTAVRGSKRTIKIQNNAIYLDKKFKDATKKKYNAGIYEITGSLEKYLDKKFVGQTDF